MTAVELTGDIDDRGTLVVRVPDGLRAGPVRVIVLVPDEDEGGTAWVSGIAEQWSVDLADVKQDIYTLEDGQPVNAAR